MFNCVLAARRILLANYFSAGGAMDISRRRLTSIAPTGARNSFAEFANSIEVS